MKDAVLRVRKSYGRCLAQGDVIGRFYAVFLDADPAIRAKFAHTDLEQQKRLLRLGVTYLIMYANGDYAGQSSLNHIRDTHGQHFLNIKPDLYEIWQASLLKTVAEFDPEFSADLERDWKTVLAPGIAYITAGYQD